MRRQRAHAGKTRQVSPISDAKRSARHDALAAAAARREPTIWPEKSTFAFIIPGRALQVEGEVEVEVEGGGRRRDGAHRGAAQPREEIV